MNPLISIWSRPTDTLRYMLKEKTARYGFFIFFLGTIGSGFFVSTSTGLFDGLPLLAIVLLAFSSNYIGALLGWWLSSVLYTWIGKWLGGTGTFSDMARIVPAGTIPIIWLAPMNFLLLAVYGSRLFEAPTDPLIPTNLPIGIYFLTNMISIGVGIYGTVLSCKGIGLVHGFSAWRGLGVLAIVFAFGVVLGVILIFFLVFSLFSSF